MAMPIVSFTAFAFGRNPFIWAFWAYLFQFWCLIPLFLIELLGFLGSTLSLEVLEKTHG